MVRLHLFVLILGPRDELAAPNHNQRPDRIDSDWSGDYAENCISVTRGLVVRMLLTRLHIRISFP